MTTPQSEADPRRWIVLGVVAVAQLMVVLDATIVNIALPSAQKALHFADSERQWIITAYALAFGSLLLLGGRLGDLFGRKWTFIAGLVGFAVASAVGGAAPSFGVLAGARALQGAFGALLAPAALSTLTNTFTEPSERGRAFGVYGAVAGGGGAVGLLLGGLLTEYLSWRWCLYVNLLFAAAAVIGAVMFIRNDAQADRPPLDLVGTATAAAGLFGVVFGFSHADTDGWGDPVTIAALAAAVVLLTAFVLVERRVRFPLLPLRIVLDRNRGGAYIATVITAVSIFGVSLFLTYYLQQNKHFSPVLSGVAYLPMIAFILVGSISANVKLIPILGARVLMTVGMLLSGGALFYLTQLTPGTTYAAHVLPAMPFLGLGFGWTFGSAISTATLGVARTDAGVASATVNTSQQVGGSVGTALLSTIVASAAASYARSHARSPGLAAAAAVHGYTVAFLVAGSLFVVGAVVMFFLIEPKRVHAEKTASEPAEQAVAG